MTSQSAAGQDHPPSPSLPMNIGFPPADHDHGECSSAHYGDVRNMVGSPENVSSLPGPSMYSTPLTHAAETPPTRPLADSDSDGYFAFRQPVIDSTPTRNPMGRTVSYPAAPQSAIRRRPSSVVSEVTHNILRFPRRRPDHEWTVFGELMGSPGAGGPLEGAADEHNVRASRQSIREMFHNLPSARAYRASPSRSPRVRTSREAAPPSPYDVFDPNTSPSRDRSTSPPRSFDTTHFRGLHNGNSGRFLPPQRTVSFSQTISSVASESTVMPPPKSSLKGSRWTCGLSIGEMPLLYKNILKCSVAYFIGSLFTFNPYLSGFIADLVASGPGDRTPSPSGHMVATIAVYFNPAKTFGAMVEADTFCLMGLFFAAFFSLSSMAVYWFFEVQPGYEWLADTLAIVWVGLGMSVIAWMKMWMAKPTFNTACSMTSIILFTVVVKEGGLQTLLQVAFIVLVGSLISNAVCHILWPQRATRNLQSTMTKTLDSFSTVLTMITETFLLEEPLMFVSQEKLKAATDAHQKSFTDLKKNLAEAQSEAFWGGPGKATAATLFEEAPSRTRLGRAYEDAIDSLNRLGQHLNGLRSGISVQYELVKASRGGKLTLRKSFSKASLGQIAEEVAAGQENGGGEGNGSGNGNGNGSGNGNGNENGKPSKLTIPTVESSSEEESALLQAAADAFGEIVDDLGPPLKSLSTTCTATLKRLREAFVGSGNLQPEEFHEMMDVLERALYTFESTSNHAVVRLYRKSTASEDSVASLSEDNSILAGAHSESVFLVYFFFFTLQEFSKELVGLIDAMSRICEIQQFRSHNRLRRLLALPWKFLTSKRNRPRGRSINADRNATLSRRISKFFIPEPAHHPVVFPKVTPHAPNTKQTPAPEELTTLERFYQSLWAFGARAQQNDVKYAVKVGMATAMLAAPAFFDATRPVFVEYRGEWALISFFVVISPTIGATNFLAVHRVLGTLLGAATAIIIWTLLRQNPYALAIFGFFFSMPCFYYIVNSPQYATSARFVLLTYNLTCLYSYNLRQNDISITDIAFHRASSVTVGVVWAALVSRYWWPIEARRELSRALGEFCLNIGWLYTRLVAFNSFENAAVARFHVAHGDDPTESTSLLSPPHDYLNESIMEFMAMELHLQIKLIELQGLLAQTQHEPRLKGPFPVKLYRSMLTSLQTILDKLHSMRCVTSREEWHTTVRRDFILPTNVQRREMVGNVILYFSTLAAAFRLKSPLPPYLPPAELARQRLVDAIRQLDVVKNRDVKGSRQLLFFAYALTMQGVIRELDYLGRTLQDTFGVIGESTEAFESLFRETFHEVA